MANGTVSLRSVVKDGGKLNDKFHGITLHADLPEGHTITKSKNGATN